MRAREERAVRGWVGEAGAKLGHAARLADDAVVRDSVKAALKALAPAIERAQLLLDHAEKVERESQHTLFQEKP